MIIFGKKRKNGEDYCRTLNFVEVRNKSFFFLEKLQFHSHICCFDVFLILS
jgi:hypothetical protein